MKQIKILFTLIAFSCVFFSCESLKTATHDQYAYEKTIEIKVEASNLIDKATLPYSSHLKEIGDLGLKIQKIVAYEKDRPNNEITFAMWQLLTDKDKNLLVGFFKRWQAKGQLNEAFVNEAKAQIMEALNLLIQYEVRKDKQSKESLLQLIASA
jgi:hypothetical protein